MRTAILIAAAGLLVWAADQATLDKGQKEAASSCAPCHSLRLVQSQRLSKATWNKEIDKMVGWGAKIEDRDALLGYLVANFGDDKPASPPSMSKDGSGAEKEAMSATRVAVVQAGSILFDSTATLGKAEHLIAEAAGRGARFVLFPEAFIGGYPKGEDFGARVGSRTPEGRKLFRRYFEDAIDVPGPATARLGEAARAHGVWLVTGVIERDGGTLYCTVLFFGPDGALAGKHRKLMPTAMERLIWGFGDGSTLPVLETGFGKVGAVICWENYMPLLRAAMYAKGIQLYCAPTVDDREVWPATMRHIALEGRCFVLSACQFSASEKIGGGSLIVGPLGKVLAGPNYEGEGILTADLDIGETAEGKFDLDVAGHYARPDVFRLEVNEGRPPQHGGRAD